MPQVLLLVLATALAYCNSILHPFVHDDIVFILNNAHIDQWHNFKEIFSLSANHFIADKNHIVNGYYRPILELFYRIEYQVFGYNPAGYHAINLIVHLCNGLLVYALLLRLEFKKILAFVVSLLFLIHPIQTESVACISGISNLLAGLFILITLHSYFLHRYFLAVITCVIALLTKEQSIIVLPVIILIDVYKKQNYKYFLWFLFFFFSIGFLLLRTIVTGSHLIDDILRSPGELILRIQSVPNALLGYWRLMLMPADLHYYRNLDILADHRVGYLFIVFFLSVMFFVCRRFVDIRRTIVFGLGWFLICLSPVLNIIPLINEYSYIFMAEHFLYLPLVGGIIVLAVILERILRPGLLKVLTIVICFNFIVLSLFQNNFWRSEIALFERMVRFEPHFGRGHLLLANAYFSDNQLEKSVLEYQQALEIMQKYAQKASNNQAKQVYLGFIRDINAQLGVNYQLLGDASMALEHYQQAISLNVPNQESILNNMGLCYLQLEDKIQAEMYFKLSLGTNPGFKPAKENLEKLISSN